MSFIADSSRQNWEEVACAVASRCFRVMQLCLPRQSSIAAYENQIETAKFVHADAARKGVFNLASAVRLRPEIA